MRVWGNRHLDPNVVITAGVNDTLELLVDGMFKSVTLAEGMYLTSHSLFTSTLPDELNVRMIVGIIAVTAKIGGIHDDKPRTVLVLEHNSGGTVEITGGTAYSTLIGSIFMTEGN